MRKKYNGLLDLTKMPKDVRRAYDTWLSQKQRCSNPKHISYKNYGQKGISVEYTSREFVAWWLREFKKFNGKTPTVGRIDHSKNYAFGNIEMIDRSENIAERNRRIDSPTKKACAMVCYRTKKELKRFSSRQEAANFTGIEVTDISRYCSGEYTGRRSGITFRDINEQRED